MGGTLALLFNAASSCAMRALLVSSLLDPECTWGRRSSLSTMAESPRYMFIIGGRMSAWP
jgi:hypothetical protein